MISIVKALGLARSGSNEKINGANSINSESQEVRLRSHSSSKVMVSYKEKRPDSKSKEDILGIFCE